MNLRALLLSLIGCCLLLAGCQRQAAIPDDSFRLTVDHMITERDNVVSILTIHVPHNASISLATEGSHCMVTLANSPVDAPRDGEVALVASRVEPGRGDVFASIQTFVGAKIDGNNSGFTCGYGSHSVPATTTLDSCFSVSAANGDYKLDTPIEIGRMNGKPMTLVVGKPVK